MLLLQLKLAASIVLHGCFEQSNIGAIRKLQQQWAFALVPSTPFGTVIFHLQTFNFIGSLRPLLVPAKSALGHTERGLFARDVQE